MPSKAMPRANPRHVIVEILRNAKNAEINKTKLYKASYLSHLVYTHNSPGLLTDWKIAHMPQGPGIDSSYELLEPLEEEGYLTKSVTSDGIYTECVYRWTGKELPADALPPAASKAIKRATEYVLPMSATQISNLTHEHSRSWIEGKSGDALEIYTDLIDDEEYERRAKQLKSLEADVQLALKDVAQ
jgi:hypothetical protein